MGKNWGYPADREKCGGERTSRGWVGGIASSGLQLGGGCGWEVDFWVLLSFWGGVTVLVVGGGEILVPCCIPVSDDMVRGNRLD